MNTSRTATLLFGLTLGVIVMMAWTSTSNQPAAEIPITAMPLPHSTPPASEVAAGELTPRHKAINDTVEIGILAITVHEIQLAQPSEATRTIVVDLTIENTEGTVIDLAVLRIYVKDSADSFYVPEFRPPGFDMRSTIQTRTRIRGQVLFRVPTTATALSLGFNELQPNGISGPYFTIAIP